MWAVDEELTIKPQDEQSVSRVAPPTSVRVAPPTSVRMVPPTSVRVVPHRLGYQVKKGYNKFVTVNLQCKQLHAFDLSLCLDAMVNVVT